MIWGRIKNSPKSFFFIFSSEYSAAGCFLCIFTNICERAQSAVHCLQKQLLTHLRSNLGYTVYTHQHIPVMIIPVCMIKHYLDFNTETEFE